VLTRIQITIRIGSSLSLDSETISSRLMIVYNDTSGACCASIYQNLSALRRAGVAAGPIAERNQCAPVACGSAGVRELLEKLVPAPEDGSLKTAGETPRQRRRKKPPAGYLTVSQLADRVGAAPSTIYYQIAIGGIPACAWRGVTVINETAAEEFVAVRPLRRVVANAAKAESGQ
jgi:hypothetical protein